MFAGARVPWPAALKQMWNVFSAFNLNIDIVAPECLVPGVSYVQKWLAFESIPACVGLIFIVVHGLLLLYKRHILGQRSWEQLLNHVDDLISSYLILFFFLFLQLFKMQVCVMLCCTMSIGASIVGVGVAIRFACAIYSVAAGGV